MKNKKLARRAATVTIDLLQVDLIIHIKKFFVVSEARELKRAKRPSTRLRSDRVNDEIAKSSKRHNQPGKKIKGLFRKSTVTIRYHGCHFTLMPCLFKGNLSKRGAWVTVPINVYFIVEAPLIVLLHSFPLVGT